MAVELYPHQLKALGQMHNGCVLRGGVGSGKTLTSLGYYLWKEKTRDILVITTAKKRNSLEWEKDAALYGIGKDASIAGKLTVDSWNNIENYKHVEGMFVIFDEQRAVGKGAWSKAMIHIAKHNRWIMLSATPGDTWMDYVPLFIANGFYKNRTEFNTRHVVFTNYGGFPKVERYVDTGYLEACRKKVLVEMPYLRHTKRHVQIVPTFADPVKWDRVVKDRWNFETDEPIQDAAELFVMMRKVSNSDPSRLGAVLELYERHPKLIIFYNFDYELEMLRTLSNVLDIPVAEYNGHKHQDLPEGDRWLYLVQYTAGAEGWNCTSTDAVVFFTLNYSFKLNEQARGRIDRLNTPYTDLYYYVLQSNTPIDRAIWKAIMEKRDFNEARHTF